MPAAFRTTDAGHLEIDGCDVVALADEFGAPLWVISESTVRDNYRRLRDAFRRVYAATDVLYATKANPQPAIIAAVLQEGALVDAVTLGHLKLILRAGGTPDRIVFNGNSKTEEEVRFALDRRVAVINVDSLEEMQMIASLQPVTATVPQQVCLRIAVDNTRLMAEDPELAKSDWLGKFGMDPADALAAAEIALAHPGIALAGLHNHLGFSAYGTPYSPRLDVVRHERCVEQTLDVARSIREEHGHRLAILNMGGGYRVGNPAGYGPGALTEFPTADDYAMAVGGTAKELCAEWDLGTPRLILEAGGYLVTDAVVLLARVGLQEDAARRRRGPRVGLDREHVRLPLRPPADVPVPPRGRGGEPHARRRRHARLDLRPDLRRRRRRRRGPAAGAAARRPDRRARQRLVLRGGHVRLLRRPDPARRDGVGGPRRDHATARDRR